ncbi:4-hydroxy-tetrahydrodipicolinate reductase [Aminipila butyrica]|uniref:4-hydroxy-tetrahydrodipicolinate reductase n=1 Tax=Aminipila butyrica TaxID=433296 RepID=A0A858BWL6_9FIRM|nr:4-hydroxy-tetrahydrodipicolinate reductase [Aminipila butyrica]QIB68476.1 4-hydroxy-tetrahydrodipicolinate reductase [Aminipila butyrica]
MNIAIVGAGAMGKVLEDAAVRRQGTRCVGVIEPLQGLRLRDIRERVDVVVDFSHPVNLNRIEEFVREAACGLVMATTGFSQKQEQQIRELAQLVPVVQAANFSLGIAVMKRALEQITPVLQDSFDMEIIEKHHRNKVDAPSGTANFLAQILNPDGAYRLTAGRQGEKKRGKEIGIHAVRGGSIAGEHTVIFAGEDEMLEIKHTALSKKVFALGALKAAEFLYEKLEVSRAGGEKAAGLYSIEEVLFS